MRISVDVDVDVHLSLKPHIHHINVSKSNRERSNCNPSKLKKLKLPKYRESITDSPWNLRPHLTQKLRSSSGCEFFLSFNSSINCSFSLISLSYGFIFLYVFNHYRSPTAENLVPIRLDIEIDGQRFKDAFTWNPSGNFDYLPCSCFLCFLLNQRWFMCRRAVSAFDCSSLGFSFFSLNLWFTTWKNWINLILAAMLLML